MAEEAKLNGPDLTLGVAAKEVPEGGMLLGQAEGESVLLARRGGECFAIGAVCTHYGGPLAEGLVVGDTVRCPWHHACFSLRNGEALKAPALDDVASWRVEEANGRVVVRERRAAAGRRLKATAAQTAGRMVIIGGGAAGNAAAEMLRREGYDGAVTMISDDSSVPYDRPNLSKEYLSGEAPEEFVPLRSPDFYRDSGIELLLRTRAARIDARGKQIELGDGRSLAFDALLLATGAEPLKLQVPGAERPQLKYLRSRADCDAIIAAAGRARRAVIVGTGFIGMEVAAALRTRGIEVAVVAPQDRPMAGVLGPELGDFLRGLHEGHGVTFHLGRQVAAVEETQVLLDDGTRLPADLIVAGIGVRPRTALAEGANLALENGVVVDERLATSAPAIFAAGDIARWPDRLTGERIRVEHWIVAERQGQVAALNMLGRNERFADVPVFWTRQFGISIAYAGHATRWDAIDIDGSIAHHDCMLTFRRGGRKLAVVTIGRGRASLAAEVALAEQQK